MLIDHTHDGVIAMPPKGLSSTPLYGIGCATSATNARAGPEARSRFTMLMERLIIDLIQQYCAPGPTPPRAHHAPGFIPGDPRSPTRARRGPATVRRVVDSWHARLEKRLVLTRVEVAPHALRDVIATRQRLLPFGAWPRRVVMPTDRRVRPSCPTLRGWCATASEAPESSRTAPCPAPRPRYPSLRSALCAEALPINASDYMRPKYSLPFREQRYGSATVLAAPVCSPQTTHHGRTCAATPRGLVK
jgi:uncharacterized protein YjiS (DUF1127 family)